MSLDCSDTYSDFFWLSEDRQRDADVVAIKKRNPNHWARRDPAARNADITVCKLRETRPVDADSGFVVQSDDSWSINDLGNDRCVGDS